MQKLLSDIDLSRSAPVAAFFELEAAARSCMCYFNYSFLYVYYSLSLSCMLNMLAENLIILL